MWVPGEFIDFFVVTVIFAVWSSGVKKKEEAARLRAAQDSAAEPEKPAEMAGT